MVFFARISVAIMTAACLVFMWCPQGHGAESGGVRAELRGMEKVYLSIECLTPDIETDVLTDQHIRSEIRRALRGTSLQVIPGNRYHRGRLFSSVGILKVGCKVIKMQEGGYGYDAAIRVFRGVEFKGEPPEMAPESIPVWSVKKFDIAGELTDIENEIKALTQTFVQAYSSVNPRRPGSRSGKTY